MNDEVITIVEASMPRRTFGVAVLLTLGAILLYIALSQPPSNFGWQAFLVMLGVTSLWMGRTMWQATQSWIELTPTQVRTSDGMVIAELADIKSVDRGALAFKPSNGFMLRLRTKAPRRWRPGLWWCLGRTVGVGGVTNAAQTKAMAEVISSIIAQR